MTEQIAKLNPTYIRGQTGGRTASFATVEGAHDPLEMGKDAVRVAFWGPQWGTLAVIMLTPTDARTLAAMLEAEAITAEGIPVDQWRP